MKVVMRSFGMQVNQFYRKILQSFVSLNVYHYPSNTRQNNLAYNFLHWLKSKKRVNRC